MSIFRCILKNIKLRKNIKKIYIPFFSNLKKEIQSILLISNEIPSNINIIYKGIILKEKKYHKLIEDYELLKEIDKHNNEINILDTFANKFDYTNVLAAFDIYSKEQLLKDNEICKLIDSYKYKDGKYINYSKLVHDLFKNKDKILKLFDLYNEYNLLLKFEDKYYDLNDRNIILNKVNEIKKETNGKKYYSFANIDGFSTLLSVHNLEYIEKYKTNPLFDNINNKSLDLEQRTAVLKDDVSALTIAGAGSGKTLTICGKVKYLLEIRKVNPADILLLSYSKKSADDLAAKVKSINNKLEVGTFHKIGLSILSECENKSFVVEDQYTAIIEKYFREDLKFNPEMMRKVLFYYSLYLSNNTHFKYNNDGEKYEDLKKLDYTTLKSLLLDLSNDTEGLETIKKEYVKSYEELMIANFYFINGINYTYEKPYEVDTSTPEKRQYLPDFYLDDYKIYHEHYGIDKEGKANQYKGQEAIDYVEGINWKRKIHEFYKTTCIETYSYEFDDGVAFENLKQRLIERGVKFNPLTNEEIYNALNSIYESMNFKSFITLIRSFVSLYKSRYSNISHFDELKKSKFKTEFEKQRAELFIDICKGVYTYYMNYLSKEGKIDFDDMILKSITYLPSMNNYRYKYIIVDEFQDISFSRMQFLKSLINHGNSKLFAVGDDWQAIYRFSGCDLNIFLNFQNYFGESVFNYITSTHRNSQNLQDIAGPFIKKNPEQINKTIKSSKKLDKPIKLIYFKDKRDAFYRALQEIYLKDNSAHILVLGRNNKDIEPLLSDKLFFDRKKENDGGNSLISMDYKSLDIRYSTVHSSKGLEEDYVILINADDARLGFPNKVEDDPLLNLVLSSNSEFLYAEERRLWYVALTRTRSYIYILVNASYPSKFVEEIEGKCEKIDGELLENVSDPVLCPYCKSGRLVLRTDGTYNSKFFGCSNYPFCKYTINDFRAVDRNIRCKKCGDIMIYRKGKFGPFYGCHNYPRCNYVEKYIPNDKLK